MKAAIIALTRGYHNKQYYLKLISRNLHIFEQFNKKFNYPLILFHEGNINADHQQYIKSHPGGDNISFVDISEDFKWPSHVGLNEVVDKNFNPNYSLMCRFNSYQIWKYVADYDFVWRIDEDTLIGSTNYDVFQYMQDHDMDYLMGRVCEETHKATNESIPAFAETLLKGKWTKEDYIQDPLWVPYTNLYIARTKLFLRPDVQEFLKKLTEEKMFLTHRWGDHVVSGIVLKAFSSPEKISYVPDFEYYHGSHNCITRNGRALRGLLSKKEAELFDCVPTGNGDEHIAREFAKGIT